jgi:hemerythrin superfamily protein
MARAKQKRAGKRKSSAAAKPADAIALLKSDHRQVEEWFEQFEKTRSEERKGTLAKQICAALTVHATIEEEIFYPAFLEATEEEDLHHEAAVEHDGAKKLIAQIEATGPQDEYYDARVSVLSEMIKHHVKEEEQPDGMFAKARKSEMDLAALGEQLASRKAELEGDATDDDDASPSRSGRPPNRERSGVAQRMAPRSR